MQNYTRMKKKVFWTLTHRKTRVFSPNSAQKHNIEKHVHSLQVATKFPG